MSHTSKLSDLFCVYLRKHQRRLRWATLDKTERCGRYVIKALGDIDLKDFDYDDAEDFQTWLAERVRRTSVNSFIKQTRPVFSWAVRRSDWPIEHNPFDDLKQYRVEDKEIRAYNPAEVQVILESATELWRARILAAVTAGLRRAEVLNCTWDDIDFNQQIITVRPKKDTDRTWQWSPKSYEKREVPLNPILADLLMTIKMGLPLNHLYPFLSEKRYYDLKQKIGSISGRVRNTPDENFRPFRNLLKRLGIVGCFHDLRRTAITVWSRSLPYQEVQRLAGHSDIQTTLKFYSAIGAEYLTRSRQASIVSIGAVGSEPTTS